MVKMKNVSFILILKPKEIFLANPLTGNSIGLFPLCGSLGLTPAPYWITVSVWFLDTGTVMKNNLGDSLRLPQILQLGPL